MLSVLAFETNDLVINGLMSAFVSSGFNCKFLKAHKAVFDAFYEFNPDIFICYPNQFNKALEQAESKFNTKFVILKTQVRDRKLFGYNPKPAANLTQLKGKPDMKFYSEFSYINLAPTNQTTLNYLENFIGWNKPYLKIFGNNVPYINYIGKVTLLDVGNILASSSFSLDLYNDLILDAWMNNCIAIPYRSNPELFPEDLFGRYEEPEQLKDILKQDKWIVSDVKNWIRENHTYYHRTIELLELLGHESCCQNLHEKIRLLK